jgi:serine/threonine-protein kinase
MGVVFKAHHPDLDRLVALKMIRDPAYASDGKRRRFQAEARTVAHLNHPNVVQIYDVGEHGGLPYFAMEYCPGGRLDHKHKGTPLPAGEAAELTEALARAVHAAHSKGVLHRDLKPANVLLAEDGTPKVTDFGLAKRLNEPGLTESGVVMGTASYMAPEQAAGRKDLGPPADVWALGAILYELLTGRPPFKAATDLETILQVIQEEPAAPSRLNRGVPADLEAICLKCLQKDPAIRYPSALALAEALQGYRTGEPPVDEPSGSSGPNVLRRWWPWRSLAVAAGLLVAALVLVALWLSPRRQTIPLKGDITALITSERDGKFNLPLRDPEALPARDGYQFRVEAHVAPAAYLYILAIDEEGKATPMYPWQPGRWDSRPPQEQPVDSVSLPTDQSKGWKIRGPRGGMNALVMLACQLPLELADEELRSVLAEMPPQRPYPNRSAAIWLENGREVLDEPDRLRTFDFDPSDLKSPVARLQALIRKLQPHAAYTRAVAFAKEGQ